LISKDFVTRSEKDISSRKEQKITKEKRRNKQRTPSDQKSHSLKRDKTKHHYEDITKKIKNKHKKKTLPESN